MTAHAVAPDEKRRWYFLALRHRRICWRLNGMGFPDAAVFHAYHAYECAMSALIAARGYPVPPRGRVPNPANPKGKTKVYQLPLGGTHQDQGAHVARDVLFRQLADPSRQYMGIYRILRTFLAVTVRNDALYYDPQTGQLPQDRFNTQFVANLYPRVREFMRDVWDEIR